MLDHLSIQCADVAVSAAFYDAVLAPLCPEPDPAVDRADDLVRLIDAEPGIRRTEDLAARLATTPRSLQRFCAEWIGVGPKELVRWARLHEAAGRAAAGPVDWSALAAELGYADQAHLVRDFTRVVGEPPALRSACVPEAVRVDGGDVLLNERVLEATTDLPVPATLLWATRGMFDQTPGLYDEVRLARLGLERSGITAREVPDTNHYSIVWASQGVEAISAAVREAAARD